MSITLALSIYKISTEDKKEFYLFFSEVEFMMALRPNGDAIMISAVSKFAK
jgi:hypothetical protein